MGKQQQDFIKEKFQQLYGVRINDIIFRDGEYLLKTGTHKEYANKLSSTLRNDFQIGGPSQWGTKEIGSFKGHFHISLNQSELESLIPTLNHIESIIFSQGAMGMGAAASPAFVKDQKVKKDPQKLLYGNNGFNSDLNALRFTAEDSYVSPRKQHGSRELTQEAQAAGREVMNLVGATDNRPGFVNKENSPLKTLQNNGGSIKVGNATYTSSMLEESLNSVRVFYDGSISKDLIKASLEARDSSVSHRDRKSVTDEITNIAGHRVMTAKGHIFNDNKFAPLDKIVEVTIMDASAPDLNTKLNKTIYLQNGTLDATKYKAEMLSRVKLLIKAAEANGCTTIVLPSIGAGAFANGHAQEVATIIATCFKEILTRSSNITLKNIVFSVMGKHLDYYKSVFQDYNGNVNVMLTEAEMTNVAIKLSELPNENVAYVIAGHPTQKIGNGWKVDKNGCSAQAQEETCTKHFVDFIAAFDKAWNPNVTTNLVSVNVDSDVIPDAGLIRQDQGQFFATASPHSYDDYDYDQGGAGGEASASNEDALYKAILENNVPLVAEILKNGVDLSFMDPVSNLTALDLALEMGLNSIVQMICNHEDQKDNSDDEGAEQPLSPPFVAIGNGGNYRQGDNSSVYHPSDALYGFQNEDKSGPANALNGWEEEGDEDDVLFSSPAYGQGGASSSSSSSFKAAASPVQYNDMAAIINRLCDLVLAKDFAQVKKMFLDNPTEDFFAYVGMALDDTYVTPPHGFIDELRNYIPEQGNDNDKENGFSGGADEYYGDH